MSTSDPPIEAPPYSNTVLGTVSEFPAALVLLKVTATRLGGVDEGRALTLVRYPDALAGDSEASAPTAALWMEWWRQTA